MPQKPSTILTLTLEGPENLINHIVGLERALLKRNEEIASLREENDRLKKGIPDEASLRRAFMAGKAEATESLRKHADTLRSAASELTIAVREVTHTAPSGPLGPLVTEEV